MIDPISDAINELTKAIFLSSPNIIPINIPVNKKNGMIVEESVLINEKITIIIIAIIIVLIFIISFILILSPQKNVRMINFFYLFEWLTFNCTNFCREIFIYDIFQSIF